MGASYKVKKIEADRPKRIKAWFTQDELTHQLSDRDILSWLLEEGSITKRISSKAAFRLQILFDSLGLADEDEYTFLDLDESPIRIREVSLYGDEEPLVFARSVIPELTSRKGSPSLGTIGSSPLGDLLFQSDVFIQTNRWFAPFHNAQKKVVWGRLTRYEVEAYPLIVMEVFLLPDDEH
ncbi:MAG: hypothetical protein CMP95_09715 [Gammaproteobacteria bacterium]|uniref:Chorismate lyase n=1 Tax=OM182 bacterium TaxID=2510334 RepID=A0A520RZY0_9GAMM|nr:hypothetical protein [Gammaproteobacteria bacterium]RZO75767.1 MAG: chorismate lyase [OM182 bacterium]